LLAVAVQPAMRAPVRATRTIEATDPVVAAAGDIACDPRSRSFQQRGPAGCGMDETARLLDAIDPDAILTLGDNQYVCGAYRAFERSFDATWGRFGSTLHPTPGDHEYMTEATGGAPCSSYPNATGYFRYFGARAVGPTGKSWYSFGLTTSGGTTWHVISLNSNCLQITGGCVRGSPEERWLRNDLATNPSRCTLAYFYDPRFSSGKHGDNTDVAPFWADLYRAGAEIVLDGHSHDYERFAPQTPAGASSPLGIREFVVGTGGIGLAPMERLKAHSKTFSASSFGVLRLQLEAGAYSWRFVPVQGGTFTDSGSGSCHGPPSP
jgi:acid phosphatase type 7